MGYSLLIKKIKEKKPLDRLDDKIILEMIVDFLNKNKKIADKINFSNEKNSVFKQVLKSVRNELNKRYGVFWSDSLSLEGHKSSLERKGFYKELYYKIFEITGKPESIFDISCGLNPLSTPYMDFSGKYICSELSSKDCDELNKWFKNNNINGKALQIDLRKKIDFAIFPKVDVVFLFKVFDSVEEKGHKLAEDILKNLKCKYAVVSFSTQTVRGAKMNFPNRGWIERLLKRLGLSFDRLEFSNEIFYVIKMR